MHESFINPVTSDELLLIQYGCDCFSLCTADIPTVKFYKLRGVFLANIALIGITAIYSSKKITASRQESQLKHL